MKKELIIDYAIKGINADIEELEKDLKKSEKYIEQYYKGEKIKTKLTIYEIKEICKKKQTEIEELEKSKNESKWKLIK